MRKKIILFIVLIFIALLVGVLAGWKYASLGAGIIGAIAAICSGKSIRDDGRGNNSGIDEELGKARDVNIREGSINSGERERLAGERRSLDLEKSDTKRERELLEELQKRHAEK